MACPWFSKVNTSHRTQSHSKQNFATICRLIYFSHELDARFGSMNLPKKRKHWLNPRLNQKQSWIKFVTDGIYRRTLKLFIGFQPRDLRFASIGKMITNSSWSLTEKCEFILMAEFSGFVQNHVNQNNDRFENSADSSGWPEQLISVVPEAGPFLLIL